ncbi:MAG: DUF3847 domain-containing protein [Planctomycetota bacterium]|nr:DUF3847 domain-containing protein [Planctomycetota bacterium]
MDSELKNAVLGSTGAVASIERGNFAHVDTKKKTGTAPPSVQADFTDPAKQRWEKIKRMEARLQREKARDTTATRKERNGQLFVWGAMVEAVYRDGDALERARPRGWAKRKLTDKRHFQRAENGFARIEDEAADTADFCGVFVRLWCGCVAMRLCAGSRVRFMHPHGIPPRVWRNPVREAFPQAVRLGIASRTCGWTRAREPARAHINIGKPMQCARGVPLAPPDALRPRPSLATRAGFAVVTGR